jgi:diguanylate cyclase (GGDEF)-like protein/PAS domain S-box-containing protein
MNQPSNRLIFPSIAGLTAASVLFIAGVAAWSGYTSWQRARESAEATTTNLVSVVERQLGETLAKVEASTLTIVAEVQHEKRQNRKFDVAQLSEFLAVQKSLVPEIDYFGMADAQGVIQIGNGAPKSGIASVADRDYFIQLRDHPEVKSVLYGPLAGKVSKRWVVGFAARLSDKRGNFDGVVFSAVPVAVIQRHLESLNLGKSGAVTVRSGTFAMVARATSQKTTPINDIGSTKVSTQLQAAIAANPQSGRFIAKTALDQIERINSYSRIGTYPMYAILGLATDDLVQSKRNEIYAIFAFAGLAILVTMVSAVLLTKLLKRQLSSVEQLHESEARYTRVVAGSDQGYWEWNLKNQHIVVSPRFETMLGYSPGDWTPTPEFLDKHIHPDDIASAKEKFARHLAGDSPIYLGEFRVKSKSGDWIWIQSRGAVASRDESGLPVLVSGTHTDITDRKELTHELAVLNQDFVSFLEHTGDFVYFKDKDSRFRFCSQTLATITGHASWRDMVGKHDLEVFPPETARIYHEEELPVFRDGTPLLNKIDPFIDQNAEHGWVSTNKWPLRDTKGQVCGLFGLSRIVTDQIRLQNQHDTLMAEQKAILDNEFVAIMAANGRTIRWVNPAFEKLFAYDQGELIGKSTRLGYCNDEDFEGFGAKANLALESVGSYRAECEYQRKDGSRFIADVSGTRLPTENGESLWCFIDITERKRGEELVRKMAFSDPLTRLPNRRLFGDRFAQALARSEREKAYGTLMVLDLDNFKPLNDLHGHTAGDLLLQEAARRISACIRETDTVGRFGGDEFVVVLGPLVTQLDEAAALARGIAEKIRMALAETYVLTLHGDTAANSAITHQCTASIGAVLFLGNQVNADDLFQLADTAMYAAKEGGRNRVKLSEFSA